MLFDDTYQTIANPAEAIFRDKGSKFLSYAYPIRTDAEVKPLIEKLKNEHPKANHHCWAMRLSPDRSVFRVNDDGEPSGTAGRPILNVLLSKNITNVLVVVVRYFGGTLLGVPGLINAYKTSAEMALAESKVIEQTLQDVYTVSFGYLQMNEVMKVIKDAQLNVIKQDFDNNCSITIAIRKMQVNPVLAKLESIDGLSAKFDHTF
ncbi:IMPACT family protein [Mucilaginibacter myungsuensis]|uniref:YigZ family protein n=1 Tax=Mucilaginibacter myungsuensis TaxID=649104 RepID=A0A929PZD5_9SPHI|nr:YigZ family protein [Mucilaginibacter myungsuensis]MBE9664385.1 YigZ family protein [Mucilaginibacter myungsuensis]MDN3597096.1 YigZ family protein [Mucilaginibacter myungsuensis]